jgi:hypothetical protein
MHKKHGRTLVALQVVMSVGPDSESVERNIQNTEYAPKVPQPYFHIAKVLKMQRQDSRNTKIFSPVQPALLLVYLEYIVCTLGNLKNLKIWLG